MPAGRPRKIENLFKVTPFKTSSKAGEAGYDNPRENIDPHIKTNVVSAVSIRTGDHNTATTPEVVNVVYGTGAAPGASTTPEGTIFIQYTA